MDRIQVEVDSTEIACQITEKLCDAYTFISFNPNTPNSYLSAQNRLGISLKKERETIYSKEYFSEMNYIGEVVYCRNAYFVYNYKPGRILRKNEDSEDPSVWWDRRRIRSSGSRNKVIRANREQTALVVNLDGDELVVVEVKDDGDAGRELVIKNESGSAVDCHEALKGNLVLTVNKKGLMQIYEVDYQGFSESRQLESAQVPLESGRYQSHFWLAICEKSKICAVQEDCDSRAPKIILYSLRDEENNTRLSILTELSVYSWNVKSLGNGCFSPYIGDNLILCAHDDSNQTVYAFGYDLEKNKLTQVYSKCIRVGKYCWKLSRVGNQVCGIISDAGLILRFKFNIVVPV